MSTTSWWQSPAGLRVATLLFPPWGFVLLWGTSRSWGKKLMGSVGILLLCILYVAAICWVLVRTDVLKVEWRGGYLPRLTPQMTLPNYTQLESHRAAQHTSAGPVTNDSVYWTGFRGPERDGRYDEMPILTNWPAAGLRKLWHQPCGGGYASFALAQGRAFTIEQRRDHEVATAYEVATGRELWAQGWRAFFSESMGGDGPRATPVYDNGRVYALGAVGELRCLDAASGTVIWSVNILKDTGAGEPTYGVSASPLVVDERLIVLTGAGRGKSVRCYNKTDGQLIWSALDDETGYCSPALFTFAGERHLIVSAATRTLGLNVDDGAVQWEYPWRVRNNQLPIAQPVSMGTNAFMLSAGYFTGCAGVAVEKTNSAFATRTLWKNNNLKNKFTSSVFSDGFIYGLDEDLLTCLDASTGERKWKSGRYGYGQLVLASGHLVILSGSGELALVKATPEAHRELSRFSAIKGKTWNHPAIGGGKLLVRNGAEMACFDISGLSHNR
jgi:outer membrane protein assembly factor BamB